MHFCIFTAWAMPQVYRKLKHGKPVGHNLLPETRGYFPFFFGNNRQIKKYQYPQNPVFI
jgi:hypothetical protein